MKLYFDTEDLALAFSAAEAEDRGCNMTSTMFWYGVEEDVDGWYCEIEEEV